MRTVPVRRSEVNAGGAIKTRLSERVRTRSVSAAMIILSYVVLFLSFHSILVFAARGKGRAGSFVLLLFPAFLLFFHFKSVCHFQRKTRS